MTYRRCGKANCACADPGHPGHGPRHRLTRSVDGKTESKQLHPGPELEKVTREVANHRRFVALSQQIIEVNEQICEARPVAALAADQPPAGTEGNKRWVRLFSRDVIVPGNGVAEVARVMDPALLAEEMEAPILLEVAVGPQSP